MQATVTIDLGLKADDLEVQNATRQLRTELLALDVDRIALPVGAPAPVGARGADAPLLGTLLVAASGGTLAAVVHALQSWVMRSAERSVRLELDGDSIVLTHVDRATQHALAQAFVERHTRP